LCQDDDDPGLRAIREQRIAELKRQHEELVVNKAKGHGEYREIVEADFLKEVRTTRNIKQTSNSATNVARRSARSSSCQRNSRARCAPTASLETNTRALRSPRIFRRAIALACAGRPPVLRLAT
jgi:hypothetical protein